MSGPVQLIPPGLLGFFQLKNVGRNPYDFREDLQPSIDLFRWYVQSRYEFINAIPVVTANTPGFYAGLIAAQPLTVPSDEWWWIESYTLRGPSFAAGENGEVKVAYRESGTAPASSNVAIHGVSQGAVGTAVGRIAVANAEAFWINPGAQVGLFAITAEHAGNAAYTAAIKIARLPT